MKPAIARVQNIQNLISAFEETQDRAPNQPGLILIHGATGAGKTTAIAWHCIRVNGIYRRAGALWTPGFMLEEIIQEAKIKTEARSCAGKAKAIADHLKATGRPLFIDEVDYLVPPFAEYKAIEVLRDIHDESGAPIVLIGMEGFERKIQARKQLARRIYRSRRVSSPGPGRRPHSGRHHLQGHYRRRLSRTNPPGGLGLDRPDHLRPRQRRELLPAAGLGRDRSLPLGRAAHPALGRGKRERHPSGRQEERWREEMMKARRQQAWQAMRELKTFTLPELAEATGLGTLFLRRLVCQLSRAGYLEQVQGGQNFQPGNYAPWQLVRDTGSRCPVFRRNGQVYDPNLDQVLDFPPTEPQRPAWIKSYGGQSGWGRAWQSMRILRRFTTLEIAATTEIPYKSAQTFVERLARTGFVWCVRKNNRGRPGSYAVFQLIRDSGPTAPICRHNGQVYDPNLNQVFEPAAPEAPGEGGER